MPWHKVVIIHDDQARWSAAALMRPFIMGYHEHGSTPPENAFVYHGLNDTGDHVYYFSPEASTIALATKAFQTFDVTQCAEQPNPTATSSFDMRATIPYVPPVYLVYPQEATYVTSLPDQWGRIYRSHL
jgi:hypothetical protein